MQPRGRIRDDVITRSHIPPTERSMNLDNTDVSGATSGDKNTAAISEMKNTERTVAFRRHSPTCLLYTGISSQRRGGMTRLPAWPVLILVYLFY